MVLSSITAGVQLINMINADQCKVAVDPQHESTDLDDEYACMLLSSTTIIAIQHYSAQKLIITSTDFKCSNFVIPQMLEGLKAAL